MIYRVKWEIDIDAKSVKDAAKEALKIQRDTESWATIFDVKNPRSGKETRIDLGNA